MEGVQTPMILVGVFPQPLTHPIVALHKGYLTVEDEYVKAASYAYSLANK